LRITDCIFKTSFEQVFLLRYASIFRYWTQLS